MNAMSSIYVRIWIFRDKFPLFRGGRQGELSFVLLYSYVREKVKSFACTDRILDTPSLRFEKL